MINWNEGNKNMQKQMREAKERIKENDCFKIGLVLVNTRKCCQHFTGSRLWKLMKQNVEKQSRMKKNEQDMPM